MSCRQPTEWKTHATFARPSVDSEGDTKNNALERAHVCIYEVVYSYREP